MIMSMSSAQIAFVQFLLFGWTSEKYLLCMTSADALWNHKLPKCWAAFCCTSASKFAKLSKTELLLYRRTKAVMCIQWVVFFTAVKTKIKETSCQQGKLAKWRTKVVSAACVWDSYKGSCGDTARSSARTVLLLCWILQA